MISLISGFDASWNDASLCQTHHNDVCSHAGIYLCVDGVCDGMLYDVRVGICRDEMNDDVRVGICCDEMNDDVHGGNLCLCPLSQGKKGAVEEERTLED